MAIADNNFDELGPEKVVHLYDPHTKMRGIVVIDNTACGPAIGGVRMADDVSVREVGRLARAMTLKNAAAGLPHGGGKAAIIASPRVPDKQRLVRAFARAIRELTGYVPGPDMGTDEESMAWVYDEIARAVGLPRVLGGIPLDEIGATGFGLARCAEVAAPFCNLQLAGATMVIEGFGNVGRPAAMFLAKLGVKLIAASDSSGAVFAENGIDVEKLAAVKKQTGSVTKYPGGTKIPFKDLLILPCDVLIPAARPDCIDQSNAADIRAKMILQGANIPATREAESILHRRGILNVPDFIANAGGVICAATEYHGGTEAAAFNRISQDVRLNTQAVLARSRDEKIEPRAAAVKFAAERVQAAMKFRSAG